MITLIIGGSGSGKSEYAEQVVMELSKGQKRYYIATMQVYDEEGKKKVERHRKLRSGKGFETLECPVDLGNAFAKETLLKETRKERVALLECLSNLVANEMFHPEGISCEEEVVERIVVGIQRLEEECNSLVIVSNNVFEDGEKYDETTMAYLRVMGKIHQILFANAKRVVEVVVGIPVELKGEQSVCCEC